MTLDDESTVRVQICLKKYLYGAVSQDRLEKACVMDLFLIMNAYCSNSAMMSWNGPNFSFGSVANGLFHIN